MISLRIEGCTRVCGKSQGYLGLPIRDIEFGDGTRAMQTAWEPTPDELGLIKDGAPIIITILGTSPPPMKVEVSARAEQKAARA